MALKWQDKDPDDQIDYSVDWQAQLGNNTISSVWKIYTAGAFTVWSPRSNC
jgi:hypothetical protein